MADMVDDSSKYFAIFEVASMRMMADDVGAQNVSDDVLLTLSQDVNYRIRELVHSAYQFMKHSSRRKLTGDDINRAIKHTNHDPVYGVPKETNYTYVAEVGVFCADDPLVHVVSETEDIIESRNRISGHKTKSLEVTLDWLSVEGRPLNQMMDPDSVTQTNTKINPILINYLDQVSKTILKTDDEQFSLLIRDVSSNPKIQPIVSHLLNYMLNTIKKPTVKHSLIRKLFRMVDALLDNENIMLCTEYHENYLLDMVFQVSLSSNRRGSKDHWSLRDSAGVLTSRIINHYESYPSFILNCTRQKCLDKIIRCLSNRSQPVSFSTHYGAIHAIMSMGPDEIKKNFSPHIKEYIIFLDTFMRKDMSSAPNDMKEEATAVWGSLLILSVILVKRLYSHALNSSPDDHDVMKSNESISIYQFLYDTFGDALCLQVSTGLSPSDRKLVYRNLPEPPPKSLFTTIDIEKSGEELLDQFYNDTPPDSAEHTPHHDEKLQHKKKIISLKPVSLKHLTQMISGVKRLKTECIIHDVFEDFNPILPPDPIRIRICEATI